MSTFAEVPSEKRLILIKPKYDANGKGKTKALDDEIFLMEVPATVSHIASFYSHFPAERETKQFQILAVILHHTHVFTLALRLCFDFLMQTFQISHNIP